MSFKVKTFIFMLLRFG